jgi:hypothetical protein
MGLTASASCQISNYTRDDEWPDFHLTGDKSSWDEYALVLQQSLPRKYPLEEREKHVPELQFVCVCVCVCVCVWERERA